MAIGKFSFAPLEQPGLRVSGVSIARERRKPRGIPSRAYSTPIASLQQIGRLHGANKPVLFGRFDAPARWEVNTTPLPARAICRKACLAKKSVARQIHGEHPLP